MEAALEGKEPVPFPRPEGIVNRNISIKSGKLAAPETPSNMIRNELFVLGTEPTEFDDAFEVAAVCKEDPTLLYEDSCGCEREEKVFLKRPIITVEDMIPVARAAGKGQDWAARFVPEDMKLAMPEQSCREAIDPSWDHAQGGNSGSFQPDGSFAIEIEIGRGQFNPVWYTVPAHTPVRMTLRSVDEETHRIRYESSLARPDSGTVELNGRRSRTLTFEAIEQGIITVYCEEHPGEQMRIVIGPPLEQGDPPDERRDERRNDDDNGSDNPGDEDDDDHDDNDEEDDTDDDQSDS